MNSVLGGRNEGEVSPASQKVIHESTPYFRQGQYSRYSAYFLVQFHQEMDYPTHGEIIIYRPASCLFFRNTPPSLSGPRSGSMPLRTLFGRVPILNGCKAQSWISHSLIYFVAPAQYSRHVLLKDVLGFGLGVGLGTDLPLPAGLVIIPEVINAIGTLEEEHWKHPFLVGWLP
jgi:hypothetical protein